MSSAVRSSKVYFFKRAEIPSELAVVRETPKTTYRSLREEQKVTQCTAKTFSVVATPKSREEEDLTLRPKVENEREKTARLLNAPKATYRTLTPPEDDVYEYSTYFLIFQESVK